MDLAQLYRRRALSERAMATRHVPGSRIGSPFGSPEPRPGPVTSDVNIVNYRAPGASSHGSSRSSESSRGKSYLYFRVWSSQSLVVFADVRLYNLRKVDRLHGPVRAVR
jgi:hypothetical protein